MSYEGSEAILKRTADRMAQHLSIYLASGGREGHIIDFKVVGARGLLPTLLLGTVGRKSGKQLITPLIYGCYDGEWVIVASKGGAPNHPAWFLNLEAQGEVVFQVATQAFRAKWRMPKGQEREDVWSYMAGLYPPYDTYQKATAREIPVVMLLPLEETSVFSPEPPR